MTIFRTFTDTERAALKLHGLDTKRPSQLSDAFVLGMRYAAELLGRTMPSALGVPALGTCAGPEHGCNAICHEHKACALRARNAGVQEVLRG